MFHKNRQSLDTVVDDILLIKAAVNDHLVIFYNGTYFYLFYHNWGYHDLFNVGPRKEK